MQKEPRYGIIYISHIKALSLKTEGEKNGKKRFPEKNFE